MQNCPACREENPPRFRLCGFCGTPLVAPVAAQEIRKTVTIVFSDLKESTDLGERLDSESLREVMTRYFDAMRAQLEAHGGVIEKFIGDAIMAVFGLPTVHEDDALRAVRAASGMQQALTKLNDEFDLVWGVRLAQRIGVNTGEVVTGNSDAGQRLVTGDAVNTAARLEQAASVDEIRMGELTYRLVRDAVDVLAVEPLDLKGKAAKVPAWQLLRVHDAGARTSDATTPMVGRATEMASLRTAFAAAVAGPHLRTVTIIGDAGVGKSRLTQEFLASVEEDAFIVRGRCLPYGNGITFWPLVEILRQAAGIADDDTPERATAKVVGLVGDAQVAARLASATGLSSQPYPLSEVFWAVQGLLDSLSERGPVVVVIDDIHRAEATLLELIEHLALSAHGVPVLIVCTARHELAEGRPDWGHGPHAERIILGPLGDEQAGEIVATLLGRSGLAPAILQRVTQAAEGNPLFVEQLVSMLVDDGTIRNVDGTWRLADEIGEVRIPPTIHALLAARLDQLGQEERAVVEPASVVGLVFAESAVRWLSPEAIQVGMADHLTALDHKQLIHPTGSATDDETRFRFHHILIRDAAYGGLLKRSRAELHERFVQWADARNADADRALEFQEILGYHLEQAHRYLRELGPLDAHGISLGIQASDRLGAAGRRAFARGDMPASANLLRRAGAARPEGDPLRPVLFTEAGESLTQTGELVAADETLELARREASLIGDAALEATARLGLIYLHFLTEGAEDEAAVVAQVESAMTVLAAAGDNGGLSRAWRILTNVHFGGCRYLDAAAAAEHMIEHARLAGDRGLELRALPALATCAQLGPTPVPEAIAVVEGVLAELDTDRKSEAYTQRALANLEAMRGNFDVARALYRRSRATLMELGWRFDAALTSAIASGPVELIAGDAQAAESELRQDYEALAAIGEQNYISTTAAFLAEALYRQHRDDEAYLLTEESQRIAAEDDVATQYLWRSVRAKLLARRGRPAEAKALAREAIDIITSAQDPDSQGYAWIDLAEVLAMAGQPTEAVAAADEAAARFDSKGNQSSAARARRLRSDIEAGAWQAVPN